MINETELLYWFQDWFVKYNYQTNYLKPIIKISTLDNPGWSVVINLENTPLQNKDFDPIYIEKNKKKWVFAEVRNNFLELCGGVDNLIELLEIFYRWENDNNPSTSEAFKLEDRKQLSFIQKWFLENCNEDWEHNKVFIIEAKENKWSVFILIKDTRLDKISFPSINLQRSKEDWIQFSKNNDNLHCSGGPRNLIELLSIFTDWSQSRNTFK